MKEKLRCVFLAFAALLLIVGIVGGIWYRFGYSKKFLSPEAAKSKVSDFITKNLVASGTKVEVESVTKESGLYKIALKVSGQEINAYATTDGKLFFPSEGMDMDQVAKDNVEGGQASSEAAEIPKSDKPEVDLFVMSYCPYGTQIEKGILPVIVALGDKIDFKLRFVDYAMHGKKELDENLKQYCIQKNEPGKLSAYLGCFLKDSAQGEACVKASGIDAAKLSSCVAAADAEFKVTESFSDKSAWDGGSYPPFGTDKDDNDKYQVSGSPTLVINGVTASPAGRDPQSLLDSICSAFSEEPEECSKKLSAEAPAPGFGSGTDSGSGSDAACGS